MTRLERLKRAALAISLKGMCEDDYEYYSAEIVKEEEREQRAIQSRDQRGSPKNRGTSLRAPPS